MVKYYTIDRNECILLMYVYEGNRISGTIIIRRGIVLFVVRIEIFEIFHFRNEC